MKCLKCGFEDSKVLDSRTDSGSKSIRRRRECLNCKKRFSTLETHQMAPLLVVKTDKSREFFDSDKIKAGLLRASQNRPVPAAAIDNLVEKVTASIFALNKSEVCSKAIGDFVMDGLKKLDEVSYIRFASVYLRFNDLQSFTNFIQEKLENKEVP